MSWNRAAILCAGLALTLLASSAFAGDDEESDAGWVQPEPGSLYKVYGLRIFEPLTTKRGVMEGDPTQLGAPLISPDQSLIYVGTEQGRLRAFWLSSGRQLWSLRDLGPLGRAMGQVQDTLLVGMGLRLVGLESYTGRELFRIDVGGEVGGEMAIVGQRAIIPIRPNSFVAVDVPNKKLLWRVKRPTPDGITVRGQAVPLVDAREGVVYLGFSDGAISRVDLESGEVQWTSQIGNSDEVFADVDATPILTDGGRVLIAASYNGGFVRLDAKKGGILSKNEERRRLVGLIESEDTHWLVAADASGQILGVDPVSGKVNWRYKFKKGVPTAPKSLGNGRVAVGCTDGPLTILDASTGRPLQLVNSGSGMRAAPMVRGRELATLTKTGWLLSLRFGEGQPVHRH